MLVHAVFQLNLAQVLEAAFLQYAVGRDIVGLGETVNDVRIGVGKQLIGEGSDGLRHVAFSQASRG